MQTFWQDLRYGARVLWAKPGFTLVAVITLALGIGVNTGVFSVVYGVLLKPLPYKDADRIVVANLSPPDFRDLKAANSVFDQMAIWASNLYNVTLNNETTQVLAAQVSPEFLPMLSAPILGRVWTPQEDTQPLMVISHDFWRMRFGGDPQVTGKTLRLYSDVYTIIGVMPPEFQYPTQQFKFWATMGSSVAKAPQQFENRQLRIFRVVAHLKPGITQAQVQTEMNALSQRWQQQYPDTNTGFQLDFRPLYQRLVGDVSRVLYVLLAVVGFVLLIACANVANLMLARIATREREMAVRSALGAGRGRLMRQLLTESLLLATFGGALGLLLALWGIDVLPRFAASEIPRLTTISLNLSVLFFTLGATALTGCLFGLAPAWQMARVNLNQSLKEGGRGTLGNAKGKRLRAALVVVEVALSLVVLVGAGLLLKSFVRLLQVDPGFVSENLLTANVGLVEFKDPQRRVAVQREMLQRLAALPGVQAVGGGTGLPPDVAQRGTRFKVQGLPDDNQRGRFAYFIAISPDYFRALGTPLVAGRTFGERDETGAPGAVIISQTLARNLFPNENAVGKQLQLINPEYPDAWREIVGVVGDVRYSGLSDADVPTIYTPFAQTPFMWNYLMIRTSVAPESLTNSVRQAVSAVDPALEAANLRTMEQLVSNSVAQPRLYTTLLGVFAALALVLAAVGIYGVIAYTVTQRTHEIGVRMALGARTGDVMKLVVRQGMALVLAGVTLGLLAAWALTRLLRQMLFEVSATDPGTFGAIALLLILVALLACWLPARRATRVDPLIALRYE
jgi:predicted permease